MTNILKDLYNGDISPLSESILDPQYKQFSSKLVELEEILIDNLPEEHKNTLDLFGESYSHICDIESFHSFKSGFKLGTKIMLEVFSKD